MAGKNGLSIVMSPHDNAGGFAQIGTIVRQCRITAVGGFAVFPETNTSG
jgi:hypothetical protein